MTTAYQILNMLRYPCSLPRNPFHTSNLSASKDAYNVPVLGMYISHYSKIPI